MNQSANMSQSTINLYYETIFYLFVILSIICFILLSFILIFGLIVKVIFKLFKNIMECCDDNHQNIIDLLLQNGRNLKLIDNLRKETDDLKYLLNETRKEMLDYNNNSLSKFELIENKMTDIKFNTHDIMSMTTRDGHIYTKFTITFNWNGDNENISVSEIEYGNNIFDCCHYIGKSLFFKELKQIKNIIFNFVTNEDASKVEETTGMSMNGFKSFFTESLLFEIINSILEVNKNVELTFNYDIPPRSIIENLKFLENINKIVFVRDDEIYLNSLFTARLIRKLVSNKFNLYDTDISFISNSNIIPIKNHL
jgi:hypothetical protein